MLKIVHGEINSRHEAQRLIKELAPLNLEGTLYFGYPVFATVEGQIKVDSTLVSKQHGLIVFTFKDISETGRSSVPKQMLDEKQDQLFVSLENKLMEHSHLRKGRRELAFNIRTITILPEFPENFSQSQDGEHYYCEMTDVRQTIADSNPISDGMLSQLESALEHVTTIKPKKSRTQATRQNSRGYILKDIERKLANLDRYQKGAAYETPDGPQRIRGLAGSGKTVVLALKAAYLHAVHPDWDIVVTFYSRSLYQQFEDLIRRFSFEYAKNEPDWQKLRILHSWGSMSRPGVYSEMSESLNATAQDYSSARAAYGMERAFEGICDEMLAIAELSEPEPKYDAVLIDEAQDMPASFFKLLYKFVKQPKRLIWAYDDLQKLSDVGIPSLKEMFGMNDADDPLVSLTNEDGQPQQDINLQLCYRNPPQTLTLAHALGMGMYRGDGGLIQHFDDPHRWTEIGYTLVSGRLQPGEQATIERSKNSYPEYFTQLLSPDDVILTESFSDQHQQAEWIAYNIEKDLTDGQLEPDDILIVLPDPRTSISTANVIISALRRRKISGHLVGVSSSADEVFMPDSVALAHIHRSKGNEAAMVYIADSHRCLQGTNIVRLRNTLFTAITRSRAWVRLTGIGTHMERLQSEIQAARENEFRLKFTVPSAPQLEKMRQIYRARTVAEEQWAEEAVKGAKRLADALQRGEIRFEELPAEIRASLAKHMSTDAEVRY